MNTINYIKGDATAPQGEGVKLIAHICNDVGGWGKGFVMAISNVGKILNSSIACGINLVEKEDLT